MTLGTACTYCSIVDACLALCSKHELVSLVYRLLLAQPLTCCLLACAEQWADALHQWLGITDDHVHMVSKGKDCQLQGKKFQFLITSYNFVPKLKDELLDLAPQVMVLDEAHYIKASKVREACVHTRCPGICEDVSMQVQASSASSERLQTAEIVHLHQE